MTSLTKKKQGKKEEKNRETRLHQQSPTKKKSGGKPAPAVISKEKTRTDTTTQAKNKRSAFTHACIQTHVQILRLHTYNQKKIDFSSPSL